MNLKDNKKPKQNKNPIKQTNNTTNKTQTNN